MNTTNTKKTGILAGSAGYATKLMPDQAPKYNRAFIAPGDQHSGSQLGF